jgi:hypothetical protein
MLRLDLACPAGLLAAPSLPYWMDMGIPPRPRWLVIGGCVELVAGHYRRGVSGSHSRHAWRDGHTSSRVRASKGGGLRVVPGLRYRASAYKSNAASHPQISGGRLPQSIRRTGLKTAPELRARPGWVCCRERVEQRGRIPTAPRTPLLTPSTVRFSWHTRCNRPSNAQMLCVVAAPR